jgi:hypothetical protein
MAPSNHNTIERGLLGYFRAEPRVSRGSRGLKTCQ